jgi:hypothetical protein
MRIKIFAKKLIAISVAAISAVTLASCFDLGDFSDESAYYAAFGEVGLVYQDPSAIEKDIEREDYSIQDYFYNKNTGENFTYGDPKDSEVDEGKDIPQLPYLYMVIPVQRDLRMESFALYVNAKKPEGAESLSSLDIYFYVVDTLPDGGDFTNIKLLGDPEYHQELDEDGNPKTDGNGNPIYTEEKILYSDPSGDPIATATAHVQEGEWVSLVVENWNSGNAVEIKESQYLLLRFVNNGALRADNTDVVEFRVTNLLIRAIG